MNGDRGSQVPLVELRGVSKRFGQTTAVNDVTLRTYGGRVTCLLGDNGAGKSTLIKILSGVHRPDGGVVLVDGEPTRFTSPRDAIDRGISTVFQDLALIPLVSIVRNFFLGREPVRRLGPIRVVDWRRATEIAERELARVGISVRDARQPVGTLSGGERQSVAIARAIYFGARVLVLDEPTSALGVKEAGRVLDHIRAARDQGIGIVFISHNLAHAHAVGDSFVVLNRGASYGEFARDEIDQDELVAMMEGREVRLAGR
jgi:simple sugar transport system ATP-binding protein